MYFPSIESDITNAGESQSTHSDGTKRDPIVLDARSRLDRVASPHEASKGLTKPTLARQAEEASNDDSQIKQLEARNKLQAETIDRLTAELEQARSETQLYTDAYRSLKGLRDSEATNVHLATTDPFLSLSGQDGVSQDEVQAELKDINHQILTIASTCSDTVKLQKYFKRPKEKRDQSEELSKDMIVNLGEIVGDRVLVVLAQRDYKEIQIATQLSMQAIMCFFISRFCDYFPFSPTRKSKSAREIWGIYPGVHENESQAVAARWRSLLCKHSKPHRLDDLAVELTKCTRQYLSRILCVAGVHTDIGQLDVYCEHTVGDSLKVFWTFVVQYAEKLKERVLSTDYTVVSFFPRTKYDQNTMKMQGADSVLEKDGKQPEGEVLLTTELGLRRDTKMVNRGESARGQIKSETLVKTVVIFEKELNALIAH